jgi:hypothetical protein
MHARTKFLFVGLLATTYGSPDYLKTHATVGMLQHTFRRKQHAHSSDMWGRRVLTWIFMIVAVSNSSPASYLFMPFWLTLAAEALCLGVFLSIFYQRIVTQARHLGADLGFSHY